MTEETLKKLLNEVSSGRLSTEEALRKLAGLPFEDLGFARVDHHRVVRTGIPEVVFAKDKPVEDVVRIAKNIYEKTGQVFITRANREIYDALNLKDARFYPRSGVIRTEGVKEKRGLVLVITAGTSDIPVAEEAALVADFLGSRVESLYDVGVAGIHRLTAYRQLLEDARTIVAVAGMEGALASVVAGLTGKVVIGVPVSTGYGASFGGLASLLSMLNSCVPTVTVVNIDNGFGAGCVAHKINILAG